MNNFVFLSLWSPEHHAEAGYLMSSLSVNGVFRFPNGMFEALWLYGRDMGPARFVIMIHALYALYAHLCPSFSFHSWFFLRGRLVSDQDRP